MRVKGWRSRVEGLEFGTEKTYGFGFGISSTY